MNVETTIGDVITQLNNSIYVDEIIVIDNNSEDGTYKQAVTSGARVIKCFDRGLGYAVKHGLNASKNDIVMKIDGDIKNPNSNWVNMLFEALSDDIIFANSIYSSDYDSFPVGNLVAKPALKLRKPELQYIACPLSRIYG